MADVLDDELSAVPNVDGTDSDDELPSSGGAATDDSQPASSALHENIRRKGANSYYYAHKTKIDAPAWDGQEAPRLLAKETRPAPAEAGGVVHEAITKYAWGDETEKVKIYIELAEVELKQENVQLDWTPSSLRLLVHGGDPSARGRLLNLGKLYDEIEGATVRVSSPRVTVTLKKKVKASWFELKKAE